MSSGGRTFKCLATAGEFGETIVVKAHEKKTKKEKATEFPKFR